MEYLTNINVLDLRSKMMTNTVLDFDNQVEVSTKVDKFTNFSQINIPKSSFVVDEINKEHDYHVRIIKSKIIQFKMVERVV